MLLYQCPSAESMVGLWGAQQVRQLTKTWYVVMVKLLVYS